MKRMKRCPEHGNYYEPPAKCTGCTRAIRRQAELDQMKISQTQKKVWQEAAKIYPNIPEPPVSIK
jgi:hypothetical protein